MTISIKRGDRRPTMTATLTSGGTPVNFTGASAVKFIMTPENGSTPKVNAPAAFDPDLTSGRVSYSWGATDTDTVGVFRAEWEVDWGGGVKQTFPAHGYVYVEVVQDLA